MKNSIHCGICGQEIDQDNWHSGLSACTGIDGIRLSIRARADDGRYTRVCDDCGNAMLKAAVEAARLRAGFEECGPDATEAGGAVKPDDRPVERPLRDVIAAIGCDRIVTYNYIYRRKDRLGLKTHGKGSARRSTLTLTQAQYEELAGSVRALCARRRADQEEQENIQAHAANSWEVDGGKATGTKELWLREHMGMHIVFLRNGYECTGRLRSVGGLTFDVVLPNGLPLTVITESTPLRLLHRPEEG